MALVISIGEVLWDVVGTSEHLGGAPLNFAAHVSRLGHVPRLISAVGADSRGQRALRHIENLGFPTEYIESIAEQRTGEVTVTLLEGQPTFTIHRPSAYDFIALDHNELEKLSGEEPAWIYFGTLAQSSLSVRNATQLLISEFPKARRFYDVNLRPGCFERRLVDVLLHSATVAKLNDTEIHSLQEMFSEPQCESIEQFCRTYARRYDLDAVCVTRGECGCCILIGDDYVESPGYPIQVKDTIGAGDAFAAGILHGLSQNWSASFVADFANRLGALVASKAGAIPDWEISELTALQR